MIAARERQGHRAERAVHYGHEWINPVWIRHLKAVQLVAPGSLVDLRNVAGDSGVGDRRVG
jgi:hypothetical protein